MKEYMNEDGEWHRLNGPAFEWGDNYSWYYNGQLHRYYGPARCFFSVTDFWVFDEEIE